MLGLLFFCFSRRRVSLCYPGYPGTHAIDQADFELLVICLPLPLEHCQPAQLILYQSRTSTHGMVPPHSSRVFSPRLAFLEGVFFYGDTKSSRDGIEDILS